MLRWIIDRSLRFRVLVLTGAVAVVLLGADRAGQMPVDAYPEFTPPHVEVQTEALGLSAAEVEQLITVPMENQLLNGVAWLDQIRSESVPGLSSIELVFEPGTDVLDARQMVQERLTQAHILPNVSQPPVMMQPMASTSRVLMVGLSSQELTPIEQSVLARWQIKPRLMGVPGVANVAIWGQRERQLQVQVDPARLQANGITLSQVIRTTGNSLWVSPLTYIEASYPGTGGFIDTPNQRLGVQHVLPITTPADLAMVSVEGQTADGTRLRLGDIAQVVEDHQPLIGDAVLGEGANLLLVIEKFPGYSTVDVTRGVEEALGVMSPGLTGLEVDTSVFRPATAIEAGMRGLTGALVAALLLVAVGLGLRSRSWRTAVVALVAVASSVALALLVLALTGATLNAATIAGLLLSLVIVVDDVVIDRHAVARRRAGPTDGRPDAASDGLGGGLVDRLRALRLRVMVATLGLLALASPLLLLDGMTGAMLRPMAWAFVAGVASSAVVALTITPALSALLSRHRAVDAGPDAVGTSARGDGVGSTAGARHDGTGGNGHGTTVPARGDGAGSRVGGPTNGTAAAAADLELGSGAGAGGVPRHADGSRAGEGPRVRLLSAGPALAAALVLGVATLVAAPGLIRQEPLPAPQEREVLVHWEGAPGTSRTAMQRITAQVSEELRDLPGVRSVGAHVGRAVTSDQVTGISSAELWISLDTTVDRADAVAAVRDVVQGYPGMTERVLTYPQERVQDADGSTDSDLVVRVFGEDASVLREQAARVRDAVASVDGVVLPRTSDAEQEPTMEIEVDLAAAQRHGLTPGEVRRAAATLLSGIQVGNLFEEQKVFEVIVVGDPGVRHSISGVDDILVDTPSGTQVPLGEVADVRVVPQPSVIERDSVSRLVDVTAGVRGREIEDVVADVEEQIEEMTFPLEFHAEVVTQAAEQQGAVQRTWLALGAAVVAVLLLLQALFDDWRAAGVVVLTVPAALSGGAVVAWILAVTGDLGSAGATLGLLAVAGLMLRHAVLAVPELRAGTGTARARPLLVAIAASALVLVPFLFAGQYPGAQVLRPMLAVVVGGLVTTTFVLLVVLPALLARWAAPVAVRSGPSGPQGTGQGSFEARHPVPDVDVRDAGPRDRAVAGSPATSPREAGS